MQMNAQADALTIRDDARSQLVKHGGFADLISEVKPIWQIGDHVASRRSAPAICITPSPNPPDSSLPAPNGNQRDEGCCLEGSDNEDSAMKPLLLRALVLALAITSITLALNAASPAEGVAFKDLSPLVKKNN